MMITVWKFEFPINDEVELQMPAGAKVLTFQSQGGKSCVWALVDAAADLEVRRFRIVGTGHAVNFPADNYVGTAQFAFGSLVFHMFEVKR